MRRRPALTVAGALTVAATVLAGCSEGGDEADVEVTGTPSASAPASATSPSGTATAAPTGSADPSPTRGAEPPKVVETIASGLEVPWGLAFLPDGDAVVTERDSSRVLLVSGPGHRVTEIGTIEAAVPQVEAGLLGVEPSPDFARDRLLYFYVSAAGDNRVVRAELRGGRLGPVEPVFTGIPRGPVHDGGRLLFGPDGHLYVSTGDGGEPARAQDRDALGGKILRITADGEPAPGNPFGTAIWSWGHRNVQGLAFDDRGRLWASEFGDSAFDELNLIEEGANYGWPAVEGEAHGDQRGRGFTDPVATWRTDEASPSGLAFHAGHLWLAALNGERLWRVPVTGQGVGRAQGFFVGRYGRMRTVLAAPDGSLWVTTSNRDGRGDPAPADDRILRIRP